MPKTTTPPKSSEEPPAAPSSPSSPSASPEAMPDVQASIDRRRIAIDRVGVKDVVYPIRLRTPPAGGSPGGEQTTVATINMYVSLPHHQKGTHMSRFLEVLNEETSHGPLTPECFSKITRAICARLNAAEAHCQAEFTYFINKLAPVTRSPGLMDYKVRFESISNGHDDFILTVSAPATSLCPCSKEISKYGAHNQRCRIEASVRLAPPAPARGEGPYWIETLVEHLEKAASNPVYAVLKRPDEKQVTEAAYENPKFVEDIVRDLALLLDADERIAWYSINSENFESIHNHNAYAQLTRDKRDAAK